MLEQTREAETYLEQLRTVELKRYEGYGIVANGIYCQEHLALMHRLTSTDAGRSLLETMAKELLERHKRWSLDLKRVDYEIYRRRFSDHGHYSLTRNAVLPTYRTLKKYAAGEIREHPKLAPFLVMADFCDIDLLKYFGIDIRSSAIIPASRYWDRDISVDRLRYVLEALPDKLEGTFKALAQRMGMAYNTLRKRLRPTQFILGKDGAIRVKGETVSREDKQEIADALGVPLWLLVESDSESISYKGDRDGSID